MEKFITFKNNGIKKMNAKKYPDAIREFSKVIDELNPSKDDEAVLKGVCFLNRSLCYISQENFEAATTDANNVIKLYQSLRTEEQQKSMTPEEMNKDPLTGLLSLAYVRRGQVFESQLQFLDAFHEYAASNLLLPGAEAQKALQSLLRKLNVPEINQKDKELQPFSVLLLQFINETELTTSLTSLVEYLSNKEIPIEILKKIDKMKCANILFALMQLYKENEFIAINCVVSIRLMVEKGISHVWNGILVIKDVMIHWLKSEKVIGECLKFLYLTPPELYKFMISNDFILPIVSTFSLDLQPDEFEIGFFLLYQFIHPSDVHTVLSSTVIPQRILSLKTNGALMLMSKLAIDGDFLVANFSNSDISWISELVQKNPDNLETVIAAAIVISKMLVCFDNPEENQQILNDDDICKIFDIFSPLTIKNSKNIDVVSPLFALFALSTSRKISLTKIKENKLIRAASAILAMHIKSNIGVVQNIISFFYEAAANGLLDEIKETKPVLPTVMNALQQYPSYQPIVERATALAALCGHPNSEKLLRAACEQFPNSSFLSIFILQHQKDQ